jgi:ubiquinone/menaquinone biosynthesis C-methylase UbiE
MREPARREYFDGLSTRWDGFTNGDHVRGALSIVLSGFGIRADEHVIDLGCGTGNLTQVLLTMLGPGGRVTAVDFSAEMVAVASAKVRDPRVRWVVADAAVLPLEQRSADRIICFSAWPHFPDPPAVGRELSRVLRPGGDLHVVHIDSREKINAIHSGVGGPIAADLLPPVAELAAILSSCGFVVHESVETESAYRVRARWPG